jgi:hypothetical protein
MPRCAGVLGVCLFALSTAACRSSDPGPPAPTSGSTSASASAASTAPPPASATVAASSAAADPLAEKLRHCPLTVEGATAAIGDVDGGIEIVVTAKDEPRVLEIRGRVKHLEELTSDKDTGVKHGAGAGGGWMRDCPVVSKDTVVVGADIAGGSRIVVRPKGAGSVADLRAETRRRHEALSKRSADGGPG